jgi:aryl-phospho-beta-D-glucosidase BglC (GH1 family)
LPIGAWSLGPAFLNGTAFEPVASVYNNSWTRVKRTIAAASAHGLGVIVDLHGATASQNGLPHSGFSDGKQALFSDPVQVAATQAALVYLAKELAPVSNVVGIELLNEPADVPELETFCAIVALRNLSR